MKKQLCKYNWYVYIPFHDKFIFWSDDDGDCVKILLHEADVLHFWNDRHRPNVAPEDGQSIKHRKSKVILFCPWSIQLLGPSIWFNVWSTCRDRLWQNIHGIKAMCSTEAFRKSLLLSVLFYGDSAVHVGLAIEHTILLN